MKKNLYILFPVFWLLLVLLPMQVRAAGRDGFKLDGNGTVTVILPHAAQEGISSLGFSLSVEPAGAAAAEFQFERSTAEILEYRYDRDTSKLNVYVAGTEALLAEGADSLTVGRIIVRDGSGRETTARVSVVEGSLQYVYGTELKTVTDMDLPGTVQIGSASGTAPAATPAVTQSPTATQNPEESREPDESQDESAAFQSPSASPVRTPGTVSRPQSTKVPSGSQNAEGSSIVQGGNSQTAGSEASGSSDNSLPSDMSEKDEDGFIFTRSPDGEATDQNIRSKGINVILTIAVIVIVAAVVVEIVAFIVIKKKPNK